MRDELGTLSGRTVCWVGDYNNVARSLTLGAAMCGMGVRIASPVGYGPSGVDVAHRGKSKTIVPEDRGKMAAFGDFATANER